MICVSELTKTYGRTVAVDNIGFEIPPSQIVATSVQTVRGNQQL